MSDSRFNLKVEFEIYGKSFDWDCSLNWTAQPGEIDRRISEFFVRCHDEALGEQTMKAMDKEDEEKEGIWWCFTHYREATHVEKDGRHRCDPKLAGIMMQCDVGFAVELKSWKP